MIKYADVGLLLETPEVAEHLDRFHSLDRLVEQSLGGVPGVGLNPLNTPPYRTADPVRVGVLYWPRGATRCATFHCVVNSTRLDLIRTAVEEEPYQPLVLDDGVNDPVEVSMRMLPPRPLMAIAGSEQLFLLSLVDYRYDLLHNRSGSIEEVPASWDDLFETLATELNVELVTDTVNPDYYNPTSRWISYRRPLPAILDAAATAVGQRVIADFEGNLWAVEWETANAAVLAQFEQFRKCGGGVIQQDDIRRFVPSSVAVVFPRELAGELQRDPYVVNKNLVDLGITGYSDAEGVTGTQTLYGELVFDGSNTVAVEDYAATAAEDWYGWQLNDLDITYTGIISWEPTGAEDSIEWTYSLTGSGPRLTTRVQRGPWDGFPSGDYLPGTIATTPTTGCSSCGWTAALSTDDCIEISGDSLSESVVLTTSNGNTWTGTVHLCTVDRAVVFNRGGSNGPTLTLDGTEGVRECCYCPCAPFAFSMETFCPGELPDNFCLRTIQLTACRVCCPIEGWSGAGWYCVRAAGSYADCEPLELLEGDSCDGAIEICSGPYVSEEEAAAECEPPAAIVTCCGGEVPQTVTITFTGALAALGSVPMNWAFSSGVANYWTATPPSGSVGCADPFNFLEMIITCSDGACQANVSLTTGADNWSWSNGTVANGTLTFGPFSYIRTTTTGGVGACYTANSSAGISIS